MRGVRRMPLITTPCGRAAQVLFAFCKMYEQVFVEPSKCRQNCILMGMKDQPENTEGTNMESRLHALATDIGRGRALTLPELEDIIKTARARVAAEVKAIETMVEQYDRLTGRA